MVSMGGQGVIADRSNEHLGQSDLGVALVSLDQVRKIACSTLRSIAMRPESAWRRWELPTRPWGHGQSSLSVCGPVSL